MKKCLVHLEDMVKEGALKRVLLRDVTAEEAYTADEMMVVGGDKIVPVLEFDGRVIGRGEVGPVTRRLQQWYEQSFSNAIPLNLPQELLQ